MIFPDNECLNDYEESDFGSIVSTMQIESMIGSSLQMGDSGINICLDNIIPGEEGMEIFKNNCRKVLSAINKALPLMKDQKFIDFWT